MIEDIRFSEEFFISDPTQELCAQISMQAMQNKETLERFLNSLIFYVATHLRCSDETMRAILEEKDEVLERGADYTLFATFITEAMKTIHDGTRAQNMPTPSPFNH